MTTPQTNPFERQEPWVLATSSRDRSMPALRRSDLAALETASNALSSAGSRQDRLRMLAMAEHDGDHHQVAEALADAASLIEQDAPPWLRHLWSAQVRDALGRRRECDRDLDAAIEAGGDAIADTHLAARLARRRGRIDMARRLATRHLEVRPDSAAGHVEVAHLDLVGRDRASARRRLTHAIGLAPHDEVLLREIDEAMPGLLVSPSELGDVRLPGRCAILIPGQLRRLETSMPLLEALSRHADLFICTNGDDRPKAQELADATGGEVRIVEDDPDDRAAEAASQIPSMKQWLKLRVALDMVRSREHRDGFRYGHLFKLRTDFHHVRPAGLLDLAGESGPPRLVARSDKVFGGPRESMMPLGRLHDLMRTLFIDREATYWPIDVEQILRSTDAFKWYGMNMPERIVGTCLTARTLRRRLDAHRADFAAYVPRRRDRFTTIFDGHRRMASETCFARHLNMLGTTVGDHPGLAGFLLSDRMT
ncbi:MAG: hypothetical protein ACO3P9_10150 [Phycisphaerales bacterium]